jgi:methylase of polypeptide subunit release factors
MLSTLRTRGAVALISRQGAATLAQRAYSQREHLIDTLLHNPELDAGDVCNELRWMQQAVPASLPPGQAATVLEDMVVRRSEGEPLQYILGEPGCLR